MMRFSFSSPLASATLTRPRTAPCHPCLICLLVFLCFALSDLAAQELRVVVVDASAKQVAVPVWVFDATGKLLQETSSKHSGEAPLALIPGTYTIAITENERQQIHLESGESLRLVLGRSTLAIPLAGPGQQRPWQSFDLVAPLYPHPQGFPALLGDNESVLEHDELFASASDRIKQALTLARELNKAEEKSWETSLLAVQTLAELGAQDVVPDLQAVLEQSASGWIKIDMQAARGLARLLAAAETRALFRRIFANGSPRAQRAAATVAAVEHVSTRRSCYRFYGCCCRIGLRASRCGFCCSPWIFHSPVGEFWPMHRRCMKRRTRMTSSLVCSAWPRMEMVVLQACCASSCIIPRWGMWPGNFSSGWSRSPPP